jgi:hypothetical protein
MCLYCALKPEGNTITAGQGRVLQLLALLEHPDALPADLALRLARQLLTLTQPERSALQCDAVIASATGLEQARWERSS